MKKFIFQFLKKLFSLLTTYSQQQQLEKTLPIFRPTVADDKLLHPELLKSLKRFKRTELTKGKVLFHGCTSTSQDIDLKEKQLIGTRKWLSCDASYACDYGNAYNAADGNGLLWVCRIKSTVHALAGSQSSLSKLGAWPTEQFPYKFPNEFERYAQNILNISKSVALLDHQSDIGFQEILITSPKNIIEVIEIIHLPKNIDEARELGKNLNVKYKK
jgi:hypothetical protein